MEYLFLKSSYNPDLLWLVILGFVIVGLGILLRWLKQPYVVAYILAGVVLGPYGFAIVTDEALSAGMGEIGLILLLFFIGMETSLPKLLANWQLAIIGTILQVAVSVGLVILIGSFFTWPMSRMIMLGFIISLSSSAVVIKLLQDSGEINSPVGENVISILLTQDILIVPMLIIGDYLGGTPPAPQEVGLQILGGILIISILVIVIKRQHFNLPFGDEIEKDHELQVFIALIVCFGLALITASFGLSAALGAFVAGLVVHAARSTEWFHDSLHAFRVLFVAFFFVSIGLMIDLDFLTENWFIVGVLILSVYFSNHFINAAILHAFGSSWRDSLYGGALLAQIGELSFVLGAIGYQTEVLSEFGYQLMILVISLTLLISPFWITMTKMLVRRT